MTCLVFFFIMPAVPILFLLWVRSQTVWKRHGLPGETVVGFFHPNALSVGGGERVLWMMIDALQKRDKTEKRDKTVRYVVYHSIPAPASFAEAAQKIQSQFNIRLPVPVEFVPLATGHLIDETRYRHFSMIMQTIGSIRLAWECLTRLCPDYFVDTTGVAFCYPLARIAGCKVMAYTHYPAVSSDMLSFVRSKIPAHNNRAVIAQSALLTRVKVLYYCLFSYAYRLCGKCAHLVMVNSSWTSSHIKSIWTRKDVHIVYPPAPVEDLMKLPLTPRKNNLVCVAQFRAEKRHDFVIRVFARVLEICRQAHIQEEPQLILVGGCRNKVGQQRVTDMKELTRQLGVQSSVIFEPNATYEQLAGYLGSSKIGLHAMLNEHFGIGVVEYMAAGCIVVAHKSAGPAMDILVPAHDGPTGFLADSMETYIGTLCSILLGQISGNDLAKIQIRGRARCRKFTNQVFIEAVQKLMIFK